MNLLEFVDDGYTGKNMDRPDMQRMLDLVKRKQISCVIMKDFSRFSRDHIENGKYIEQIFPFMSVQFIAINDNYDSADYVGGFQKDCGYVARETGTTVETGGTTSGRYGEKLRVNQ